MILARISGGKTSRLHGFLLENTFLPIWKLTEEESPCNAFVMPRPAISFDSFQLHIPMLAPAATI